jgi:ribose transport system substrate-binding protein
VLKKSKKGFLIVLVITAIIIGLIAKSFVDEKPEVVIILKELNTQYWQIVKAGAEKGFRDFNINGKVIAPNDNSHEEQGELIDQTYKENPDVLIISPLNSSVIPKLDKFVDKEEEIPVLLVDQNDPWEHKTSYIGTDNLVLGKKAGSLLAAQLQPGDKVALIGGDLAISVFEERIKGVKITLKAAGIEIVAEAVGISDDEVSVKRAMKKVLRDHPEIKGVFATHDIVALHAFKEIEDQGQNMPVVGADGILEMLELIEEGRISGTVAQNPYDMGYLSVENAMKVAKGEKVEKVVDSGVDIIIKGNVKQRLTFLKKVLK